MLTRDPSILFLVGVLLIPVAVVWSEQSQSTWTVLRYIVDPSILASGALLMGMVHVGRIPRSKHETIPRWYRDNVNYARRANWYLINGVFIHLLMDGLIGGFGGKFDLAPLLRREYEKIDQRFLHSEPTVMTISMIELFVMTPLCLTVYYGYKQYKTWRPALELVAATLQLMGTIIFVSTELAVGMKDVPVDWHLSFSFFHIIYFWFAFVVCNVIWIVVPTWSIVMCIREF